MQNNLSTAITGALSAIAALGGANKRMGSVHFYQGPTGKQLRKLRRADQRARAKASAVGGVSGKLAKKAAQGKLGIARPIHA